MSEREGRSAYRERDRVASPQTRKGRPRKARVAAVVAAALVALAAIPIIGYAWPITPSYGWYTAHVAGQPYVLSNEADYAGFVELVNGTADVDGDGQAEAAETFADETVQLGDDLNFKGQSLIPAGGQGTASFDGSFDGQGHTIDNFTIDAATLDGAGLDTTNVGLIGAAGKGSLIENVVIGDGASLTISLSADDNDQAIENVGMIVGSSEGSISGCTNNGAVTVGHAMDQTTSIVFPIKNVGGLAGICTGDVTGSANNGALSVSETGVPYKTSSADEDWNDQAVLALNIGGVVGCAGEVDSTVDENTTAAHGTISGCANTAKITVDTPAENGLDRFGNTVYSQGANVGGVAGYSRGSIDSCTNSGYLRADHTTSIAGIVGSLRAAMTSTSYSGNFTQDGSDDGMAQGAASLTVTDCTNSGDVLGYAFSAGIVGRAGTYTAIEGCLNDSGTNILGTRSTKPFPSGIVGSAYGTVSYCANLGTVAAGTWADEAAKTIKTSAGYYASGLVGNTAYFTKTVDGTSERVSPLPEVHSCYNAGSVLAVDNMRQRALVGDNAGYVHDNVAEADKVYGNKLVYGMYSTDTESSGGTTSNNVLVSNAELTGNTVITTDQGSESDVTVAEGATALGILNGFADQDGWDTYWVKSDGSANGGYPALNGQVDWDLTDLSSATVELAANAQYTGLAAVPSAHVTLADGTSLQQNVDFRVVPQAGATEITAAGETPYTATIVGIGNYEGTAAKTLAYGIDKGDLASCTVLVNTKIYSWCAQAPSASDVKVTNAAGVEVDPSEYTFAIDQSDKNLSFVDAEGMATTEDTGVKGAVNADSYNVILTAAADSEHFTGTTEGTFRIKTAKIVCSDDADIQAQNAYPTGIEYMGESYKWDSMTLRSQLPTDQQNSNLVTFAYTGHPVKPTVSSVVYKGKDLVEGRDYRVVYGDALNEGQTVVAGEENLGVAGGEGYGYVMARYVSGSNFSNYDNMKFKISDTGDEKIDIARAVVEGDEDIVYEDGAVYTPITVWYGGSQLTEGVDYTIAYTGNDSIGQATYTITAVDGSAFTGSLTGTFNIVKGVAYELSFDVDAATGTASITGVTYNGSLDAFDLVIPTTVERDGVAYTVTSIADKAFGGNAAGDFTGSDQNASKQKIKSVSIPASVTSIGEYAFGSASNRYSMDGLTQVTFADGSQLATIGKGAFRTSGIAEIVIPAKVATIADTAFRDCASLEKVTFLTASGNTPTFGADAFYAVKNVSAYGYDSATSAKTYVTSTMAKNGWTWNSLGDAPATQNVTVVFDAQGGTPATSTQEVAIGDYASAPADPTRDGCTFEGWFTSDDSGVTLSDTAFNFAVTPITSDLTLYAKWSGGSEPEPVAFTVEVVGADGQAESTCELTASELAALASDSADPALGQYYKGGSWTVLRSTDYVTVDDLLAAAGVEAGEDDTLQFGAADGMGKWSGTLGYMDSGLFYPSAASDGTLGDASGAYPVPAALALTVSSGTGPTAAEALAAAEQAEEAADGTTPRSLMGVGADGATGGNRFWSSCDRLVVTRAQPSVSIDAAQGSEGVYGYADGSLTASVTASAAAGASDLTYQWYATDAEGAAGTLIEGATASTYTLPSGKDAGTYYVYCTVSATANGSTVSATSDPIAIVVAKTASTISFADDVQVDATSNSIVLSAAEDSQIAQVGPGGNPGVLGYAISKEATAPTDEDAWQDTPSFTGLDASSTYYVFVRVAESGNYQAAVSEGREVSTEVAGVVENPVLDEVTYDPARTLEDVELPEGWAWDDASIVPTVGNAGYKAVYMVADADEKDYSSVEGFDPETNTVTRTVALAVAKAVPDVTAPTAQDLTYGQALSESVLTGGSAVFVDADGVEHEVPGTFAWNAASVVPPVVEGGAATYAVTFTPSGEGAGNYALVEVQVTVKVAPKDASSATVTITDQYYTGSAIVPGATVVIDGKALVAGVDYDLTATNNVEIGTASYAIAFKGNYTGATAGTFAIVERPVTPEPDGTGSGAGTQTPSGSTNGTGGGADAVAPVATGSDASTLAQTGDTTAVAGAAAIAAGALAIAFAALASAKRRRGNEA